MDKCPTCDQETVAAYSRCGAAQRFSAATKYHPPRLTHLSGSATRACNAGDFAKAREFSQRAVEAESPSAWFGREETVVAIWANVGAQVNRTLANLWGHLATQEMDFRVLAQGAAALRGVELTPLAAEASLDVLRHWTREARVLEWDVQDLATWRATCAVQENEADVRPTTPIMGALGAARVARKSVTAARGATRSAAFAYWGDNAEAHVPAVRRQLGELAQLARDAGEYDAVGVQLEVNRRLAQARQEWQEIEL